MTWLAADASAWPPPLLRAGTCPLGMHDGARCSLFLAASRQPCPAQTARAAPRCCRRWRPGGARNQRCCIAAKNRMARLWSCCGGAQTMGSPCLGESRPSPTAACKHCLSYACRMNLHRGQFEPSDAAPRPDRLPPPPPPAPAPDLPAARMRTASIVAGSGPGTATELPAPSHTVLLLPRVVAWRRTAGGSGSARCCATAAAATCCSQRRPGACAAATGSCETTRVRGRAPAVAFRAAGGTATAAAADKFGNWVAHGLRWAQRDSTPVDSCSVLPLLRPLSTMCCLHQAT